jgi:hypothetical protein
VAAVLTPGIEYFGVASDDDAQAFADGIATFAPPLVRADGITPDGYLAIFGALLAARPIAQLAEPPELETLSTEVRGDSAIHLIRLPQSTSDALAAATPETFREVARRSLTYTEFTGADPDRIATFLTDLGACARAGGLYARVIAPAEVGRWRVPLRYRVRTALPFIGIGATPVLLAAGVVVVPFAGWGLPLLWAGAVIVLSRSIHTLFARRTHTLLFAVAPDTLGSVTIPVAAGDHFRRRLSAIARDVLDLELPRINSHSQIAYLVADPSGLTVFIDKQRRLHLPTEVVLAVTSSGEDPPPLTYVEPATLPRLSFVLRVSDDESELWDLAVVDTAGTRMSAAGVAETARIVAAIVDARTTDPV